MVKFTLFWDIYNQDPVAIEEIRRRRKAKFATRHGKVKLAIQLKTGDPAALLTVLGANGVDVKGLDLVRGGPDLVVDRGEPIYILGLRG